MAGTSAQAVGGYVGNRPGMVNAYRVLSSNGSVSPGFRWSDPADDRDVTAVLEAEGVLFEAGRASNHQRLTVGELMALTDESDDEQNGGDVLIDPVEAALS